MWEHLKIFLTSEHFQYYFIISTERGTEIAATDEKTMCLVPWEGVEIERGIFGIWKKAFESVLTPLEGVNLGELEVSTDYLAIPIFGIKLPIVPRNKLPKDPEELLQLVESPIRPVETFLTPVASLHRITEFMRETETEWVELGQSDKTLTIEDYDKRWKIISAPGERR